MSDNRALIAALLTSSKQNYVVEENQLVKKKLIK